MAREDNRGYVKHAMTGLLAPLTAPSATRAKSKFLSLSKPGLTYRRLRQEIQERAMRDL